MATTTTCPSCGGPLRIPDELVGQRVRCPTCQTIFDAAGSASAPAAPVSPPAPEPERPLWKDLRLELDNVDPESRNEGPPPEPARRPEPPPPAPPPEPRRLVGAVELGPTGGADAAPSPQAPRRERPAPQGRERPADYDDHPRGGPLDRGPRRRDSEPHRGVLVLVLGIISLVCTVPAFCTYGLFGLIGIPLGIAAWVLGHRDLGKIKRNEMDEEGLGTTQAGWVCGIVGTILNALVLLSCGGFITFMLLMEANNNPMAPKPAFGVPAAPAPAPPAMRQ